MIFYFRPSFFFSYPYSVISNKINCYFISSEFPEETNLSFLNFIFLSYLTRVFSFLLVVFFSCFHFYHLHQLPLKRVLIFSKFLYHFFSLPIAEHILLMRFLTSLSMAIGVSLRVSMYVCVLDFRGVF